MDMDIVAATPRAVALRLAVPGGLYHLPAPLDWRVTGPGLDRRGTTDRVVTALHDLPPGTALRIEVAGFAPLDLTTPPCAGAVTLDDPARAQAALDGLPDGGTLILPAGRWQVAPLLIGSHRHIYLAAGAELAAPGDRDGWPILTAAQGGSWEGLPEACHRALLTALDAQGITIAGPGRVDGGGARGDWWSWPKGTRSGARRARLLHLVGCRDVTVLGPTFANAPSWTLHPCHSQRLIFAALKVQNPPDSPNTDGLNPESCTDVAIEGVHFTTGDDCIAIKAGKRRDDGNGDHLAPTRDIRIRHCRMERGHGGVVIGSEMSGGVSDVQVSRCEMQDTDRGLRIKTRRGRGGEVARIFMTDCHLDGVETVLAINAHYACDPDGHSAAVQSRDPQPVGPLTPRIRDISLTRIRADRVRLAFAACLGLPEQPVTGVAIRDVAVTFAPAAPAVPLMADGLRAVSGAGLLSEHCVLTTDADLPSGPLTAKDFAPC
ncbi:glycoside hydrolase family 28 protein [Paracoccus gahaiensis]|uniref:Glycoside hydrolase family 28 protein n=1 Tax=Paracoccus gahaiensis TaxID=1706839 RepID=A0A4U0R973_9RHOB|nr:glycoside hydrolase family 28 protein [Paracoccus gahaiensis]TJZ90882.1 glycoside hydrolase family 28 protein [Paracoccus gahaiensis]